MSSSRRPSKAPDRKPPEYGRPLYCAEEAAGAAVGQVLSEVGAVIRHKLLEQQAFRFATNAFTDVVIGNAKMSFVPNDAGEDDADSDSWEIEAEPTIGEIDSWARYRLPVRRASSGASHLDSASPTSASSRQGRDKLGRSFMGIRSKVFSESRMKSLMPKAKTDKAEVSRAMPLAVEAVAVPIDEEEEMLREAKFQEQARQRDKDRRAREFERSSEEERKQLLQRHEEMKNRPHTFDQDGNIIWIEEPKLDRLPKFTEVADFRIKKVNDARFRQSAQGSPTGTARLDASRPDASRPDTQASSLAQRQSTRQGRRKTAPEPEFPDGFSRLSNEQPPLVETMAMQSGVTLEVSGKKKVGRPDPYDDRRVMSRREYNRLIAGEMSMDDRGSPVGATLSLNSASKAFDINDSPERQMARSRSLTGSHGGSPDLGEPGAEAAGALVGTTISFADMAKFAADAEVEGGGGPAQSRELPPLRNASKHSSSTPALGLGGGAVSGAGASPGQVQRDPAAPSMASRHMGKKFEAMGYIAFQKAPRYHAPSLGGPQCYGSAQPPIGATMGHGLMRHGSFDEEYFFPPQQPSKLSVGSGGSSLIKSKSEASFVKSTSSTSSANRGGPILLGGGAGAAGGSKAAALRGGGPRKDGQVSGDPESPAYRNFRHMILPELPGAQPAAAPGADGLRRGGM